MEVTRGTRLTVNPPANLGDLGWFHRNDPGKVASFATDIQMRVMSNLLIMPVVAVQAGRHLLPGMPELGGLRVTVETR